MKKLILSVLVLSFLFACKKSTDKIEISDHVSKTQYYDNEIFNEQNQNIYGKWEYFYNSGISAGVDIKPGYVYLEVVRYGIYGKITENTIKEIGKLIIKTQDTDKTIIDFWPDDIYKTDYFLIQKVIRFKGTDTLILDDNYAGGFGDYYRRVK